MPIGFRHICDITDHACPGSSNRLFSECRENVDISAMNVSNDFRHTNISLQEAQTFNRKNRN